MWRLWRAFWNKVKGLFGGVAEGIEEDPDVIAATYDASIKKSGNRVQTTKQAVAKLMGIEEKKKTALNTLTQTITTLTKRRDGALAVAKNVAAKMQSQGADPEGIKNNPEIIKARQAYTDLASELESKIAESHAKEEDLKKLGDNLARLKANLQSMQRGADSLREEKEAAIADVVTAKEQSAVDELMSGVSQESTDKDLERAREARRNVTNRAKLTAELAGLQQGASGEEYERYADAAASNSEFDNLLGLETKATSEKLDPARLPEG